MNKNLLFFLRHGVAIIIPIALMWILYNSVLQTWWLADDPALLQSIAEHGIISHFYQSEIWRSLSSANLTPWVILSLGIDWHFFGLEPLGYYWHHLLSFTMVLIIAYFVLNRFFSQLVSSLTLSLFVASIPSAYIAQFLMTRHYLEGLGLSLLAILFYIKAIETDKLKWAIFGGIFYLLATTAKEIYVPLVVVLPWLLVGNWIQRVKMLIPFLVMAGIYVLWRIYMLKPSSLLTGYSLAPKLEWDHILALPSRVAEVLGWQHSWQLLIILLISLIYLLIFLKYLKDIKWIQLFAVLLWLAVTLLPIIPVLSILTSRYLFLPYFMLSLSVAFCLRFFLKKQWNYIALGLGLSMFAVGIKSVEIGPAVILPTESVKRYRIEGEFVLTGENVNDLLLNPLPPGGDGYYQSLQWLREHILKLPKGVGVCYDLCACQPQSSDKIYQFMQGHLQSSKLNQAALDCGKPDVALTVKISRDDHTLHWQLGPYKEGQYYAIPSSTLPNMRDGAPVINLPTQGSLFYDLSKTLYVVVKYVSPEGWHTYSPILRLDPAKKNTQGNVELIWER
jgi:hypothetical protein